MSAWPLLHDVADDIRLAARTLRRIPRFTAVAILSLALGLALATSTLAVLNAYLLRSLPYPSANRLYHVVYAPQGQPEPRGMTAIDWKSLDDVIEVADSSAGTRFYLTDGSYTDEALGLSVAAGAVDALGIRVAIGRSFVAGDFAQTSESVALISHSLWRDRYGSDPGIAGRVFRATLNDQAGETESFRIVGVLSSGFRYVRELSRNMDILTPLRSPMRVYMVRLRDGVPSAFAERRITEAARTVAPVDASWGGVRLESVHTRYVSGIRPLLITVAAAVSLMLVIVCANVAVLMLLRTARQQREVSVRLALGARRGSIFRMLAAESSLICAAALALGIAVTGIMLRLLGPLIEEHLGRPAPGGTSAISIAPAVVLAAAGISLLVALSLSLVPLLTPQRKLAELLSNNSRTGTDGPVMRRARALLVTLEIAGSLALLIGCGLMIRSALNLVRTDLGFDIEHVVRGRLALPLRTYPDAPALLRFYERFAESVSTQSKSPVALTNWPPFYAAPLQRLDTEASSSSGLEAGVTAVSPGYFSILGIGISRGRGFTAMDRVASEPVALISESLARRLSADGSVLGLRIRTGEQPVARSPAGAWRTVIGVVQDVRQNPTDSDVNDVYLPFFQAPNQYAPVFIKTDRPASFWLATLRTALAEMDPQALISGVTSLEDEGRRLSAATRFLASALTGFATLAALLAVLGIYGVTAYAVQQREREVAIRIAMGASGPAVVRMFLKEGSIVLASGLAIGLLGAAALARMLENQLYGVRPFDAWTLAAMGGVMAMAGLLATWWPARGAAARAPMEVLKEN